MQKLGLSQILGQKLSPQQIQFIKLLQLSTAELESRVEEELEVNPALEEGKEEVKDNDLDDREENTKEDEINLDDYLKHDDIGGYKMKGDGASPDEDDKRPPLSFGYNLFENLQTQLSYVKLNEKEKIIGNQIVGSVDQDGYLRRDLQAISNDLAFTQNVEASVEELEIILKRIQNFDPAGVGARDLQECLLLQIKRRNNSETKDFATLVLDEYFEEFTKKHYSKILQKTEKTEDELKKAIELIVKLNPKPGGSSNATTAVTAQYLLPDFILTNENGELVVNLNARNAPELRVSGSYLDMFDAYDKGDKKDKELKKAVSFVKQKLDSAKWFMDAIRQRQLTLLNTMRTIVELQRGFFEDGDETELRPMILKNIADKIEMDISTVSRVVSSKSVQTEFGIFPLKYFFSEGIATDSGEEVSSKEVKSVLQDIINEENKSKPLSDQKIVALINGKGYNLARRTVAKYREQLNIPVARLRKEL